MKITWIGHSCFKIEGNGFSVITDPYEDGSVPGLKNVRETANMVLSSHDHYDHNAVDLIGIEKTDAAAPLITVIDTFHDDAEGSLRGNSKIHIFDFAGERAAHLGDIGCNLTPEEAEQLKNLDVVMIPVGGFYTVDAKQAVSIINKINPRIVIPMHYRNDEAGFGFKEIGTVDEFIKAAGRETMECGNTLDTHVCIHNAAAVMTPANIK